jgi:predicted RNA polymerase sigma factor
VSWSTRSPNGTPIREPIEQAARYEETEWPEIVALYTLLERMTGNPMVTLNRAVAVAMVDGPRAGLTLLDGLDEHLDDHHRLHSVRAHLLEQAGESDVAIEEFRAAAARSNNLREQHYLTAEAARLASDESEARLRSDSRTSRPT